MLDPRSSVLPRRRAIPTRTKKARVRTAGKARRAAPKSQGAVPPPRRTSRRRPARRRPPAEQPLGVGVGDAFALKRLNVPLQAPRGSGDRVVREVGWAEFGEVARELAERIAAGFVPDVVLGVVNGGVFLGGALAPPLHAEFRSVKVEKRNGRVVVLDALGDLRGKQVLVVDDVTVSGATLAAVRAAALRKGAGDVRTATLVVRPDGNHPDFHAVETRDLIVFGWDYQLHGGAPGTPDPGDVGV